MSHSHSPRGGALTTICRHIFIGGSGKTSHISSVADNGGASMLNFLRLFETFIIREGSLSDRKGVGFDVLKCLWLFDLDGGHSHCPRNIDEENDVGRLTECTRQTSQRVSECVGVTAGSQESLEPTSHSSSVANSCDASALNLLRCSSGLVS